MPEQVKPVAQEATEKAPETVAPVAAEEKKEVPEVAKADAPVVAPEAPKAEEKAPEVADAKPAEKEDVGEVPAEAVAVEAPKAEVVAPAPVVEDDPAVAPVDEGVKEDVDAAVKDAKEKAEAVAEDVKEKAQDVAEDAKDVATEAKDDAKDKLDDILTKLNGLLKSSDQKGNDTVNKIKEELDAVLDAVRHDVTSEIAKLTQIITTLNATAPDSTSKKGSTIVDIIKIVLLVAILIKVF